MEELVTKFKKDSDKSHHFQFDRHKFSTYMEEWRGLWNEYIAKTRLGLKDMSDIRLPLFDLKKECESVVKGVTEELEKIDTRSDYELARSRLYIIHLLCHQLLCDFDTSSSNSKVVCRELNMVFISSASSSTKVHLSVLDV